MKKFILLLIIPFLSFGQNKKELLRIIENLEAEIIKLNEEIRNLIKDLSIDKTILLSTHIMQEVDKICNRVLILNNGEIVSNKTIDKLKKEQINLEDHFNSLSK